MSVDPAYTRRLLLGHGFGAALMLPAAGMAEPGRLAVRHAPGRPLPLIVLDPGHGGKDPGAIGVSGTYEKHIAFAAATELARQLEAVGHYRVSLTRSDDHFVALDERVAIAQRHGAALFVSMHADAVLDHSVQGASVYTLASEASDAQSASLAARENAADRYAGPEAAGLSPKIAEILASLVRHETRVGSAHLQKQFLTSLGQGVPLLENPSRHAAFAVLKAADIPSVLVEMGFMSNRHDEAALREPAHRAIVGASICRAIGAYFMAKSSATRVAG